MAQPKTTAKEQTPLAKLEIVTIRIDPQRWPVPGCEICGKPSETFARDKEGLAYLCRLHTIQFLKLLTKRLER